MDFGVRKAGPSPACHSVPYHMKRSEPPIILTFVLIVVERNDPHALVGGVSGGYTRA